MEELELEYWKPRTKLGQKVKDGEISSLSEILRTGRRPRESEIIDILVPNMNEDILNVNLVQRMHRSGRRLKFRVTTVVGNDDGIVGVANASAREVGPAIRKSIRNAKLSVVEISRGCGSWECRCNLFHSVPFKVAGRSGSVEVTLKPAPRGLGIAASEVPRLILERAGIEDVWTHTKGKTRSTINSALATFDALKQTTEMEVPESLTERITIGEKRDKID